MVVCTVAISRPDTPPKKLMTIFHVGATPLREQSDGELINLRARAGRVFAEMRFDQDEERFRDQFGDAVALIEAIERILDERGLKYRTLSSEGYLYSRERIYLTSTDWYIARLAEIREFLSNMPSISAMSSSLYQPSIRMTMDIHEELQARGYSGDDVELMIDDHIRLSAEEEDGSSTG